MSKKSKSLIEEIGELNEKLNEVSSMLSLTLGRITGVMARVEGIGTANPEKAKEPSKKAAQKRAKPEKAKAPKTAKNGSRPSVSGYNEVPTSSRHRFPSSVRVTAHEITLNVGSAPVRELAERDARDFLNNPKVFWNRATQFPDPKRYGVQPHVESARVVERGDAKFTRAPWTVSLTVAVEGDDKKAEAWCLGTYAKNKAEQE